MPRITDEQLIDLALRALEEIAVECDKGPVRRTMALRFILAFLASRRARERWPFDHFWRNVRDPDDYIRVAYIRANLYAIYREVGRDRARMFVAEKCRQPVPTKKG